MPTTRHSPIPADSLLALRQRLERLSPKSPERAIQVKSIAELYGVSTDTVYRSLRIYTNPRPLSAATEADRACCRKQNWNTTAN